MPTLCFEMLLNHRNGCSGFSALPAQFRVSCKLRPNVRRKGCHTAVDAVLSELSPYRVQSKNLSPEQAKRSILTGLQGVKGRGKSGLDAQQLENFDAAVAVLEESGGLKAPTCSGLLEGRWRLLYTSRPGTASPIQQTFVGVDAFTVYQEILSAESGIRINNIVSFGPTIGQLKVEAEGNTDSRPLPGFTPRKGKGLPVFGKSSSAPPKAKDLRIDFQFDTAAFDFKLLPFKVPYPVPFKLFGDETKGWLDITYLDPKGDFRLSRGNKGTLFVLTRDEPAKSRLLSALAARSSSGEIYKLIDELVASGESTKRPATSPAVAGKWRLRWSEQAKDANGLQKALANSIGNYQVVEGDAGPGQLQNVVDVAPFLKVRAIAGCEADKKAPARDKTLVNITEARIELFGIRIPLPFGNNATPGYVEWLYLDEDLRVTRGNKGSYFIHTRE